MTIPFADLRDLRPTVFGQTADAWAMFARAMAMLEQEVTNTVIGPLHTSLWTGQAAAAARRQAATLDEGFALRRRLGLLAEAIFLNAQARLASLQNELLDLLDTAAPAGLTVTDDGRVLVSTRRGYSLADYTELTTAADNLTLRIQAVLSKAAEIDALLADALDRLQPLAPADVDERDWRSLQENAQLITVQLGLIGAVPTNASPPDAAAWWQTLTDLQRSLYITTHPDLVGGLDGLPALDRDQANRIRLHGYLSELATASQWSQDLQDRTRSAEDILDRLERSETSPPPMLLMGFDPTGQGRSILAIGNPDTASDTCVFVPGATLDLTDMPDVISQAADVKAGVDAFLRGHPAQTVSVIAWLGYDSPSLIDAPVSDAAEQGAKQLGHFVDGLHTSHTATGAHTSALGHSYGSAVVGTAAHHGLAVDDLIAVGSLGLGTDIDTVADLDIDPHHVWAATAPDDYKAYGGDPAIPGREPTDDDFGANEVAVDTHGHHGYWQHGSASAANIGAIITGHYDQVTLIHQAVP